MLNIKSYWLLPALISMGLAIPMGVSNKFLPSTLASSVFDEQMVYVPVVSFQTIIIFIYCVFNFKIIKITRPQVLLVILLGFTTLACSVFSLYPSGFLSYSTTWFIAPFAVAIHYRILSCETKNYFSKTVGMVAYAFLPFYVLDLFISGLSLGFREFTSYMLATNGHTFVSMLMVLFIQFDFIQNSKKIKLFNFQSLAFFVYFLGGVLSQGRMALIVLLVALLALHSKNIKKVILVGVVLIALMINFSEKIRMVIYAVIDTDFENPVVWSSMISRLKFWEVYFDMFSKYSMAGVGGLSANIIKYDHMFLYNVFVDPHNEYVYVFSGFGILGFSFIIISIILARMLVKSNLKIASEFENLAEKKIMIISIFFIAFCSLTNANSAKQNIELIVCLTILFATSNGFNIKNEK